MSPKFSGRDLSTLRNDAVHSEQPPAGQTCACCAGAGAEHAQKSTSSRTLLIRLIITVALFAAGYLLPAGPAATLVFAAAWLISGYDVLLQMLKNISRGKIFDENFLMGIATVGAVCLGDTAEAVGVMLFYQVGEFLQDRAVGRARKLITGVVGLRPETALVWQDGAETVMPVSAVQPGTLVRVYPGDRVPLDGTVEEGLSSLDTSALTGESLPRDAAPGDEVLCGMVNLSGRLTVRVDRPASQSVAAKVLELVEHSAANKAPTERFITRFARVYTPIVMAVALGLAVLPPLMGLGAWGDFMHRALVFLVVSCPCALVISVPLGFMGGIGGAARRGILVKGGEALEKLARTRGVAFDKTGTLTKGTFEVSRVAPAPGVTRESLLSSAALAESASRHPVAVSVTAACGAVDTAGWQFSEEAGLGVCAQKDGDVILAGNARLMRARNIAMPAAPVSVTAVHAARAGRYLGHIELFDAPMPGAKEAIVALHDLGIAHTALLSGDQPDAARAVAGQLSIDDVRAGLLPGDKVEALSALRTQWGPPVAFVGDGLNDAPVLTAADIGLAMGQRGTDAALEAADVVLMRGDARDVARAIRVGRKTKSVISQNIVMALGFKAVVLVLGALGIAGMWMAVMADVGVALLAVLSSLRCLRAGK